ncbi:acyl carrier protein [Streptomyces sp. NPDC051662]|uniref:acyl carrier protein n=1 Tax=Streptomyces sp. NPDC051662 TaxID=3154750 RepID=UPI003422F9F4
MENGIRDIWRRVLGIEDVGVHDNFFDVGGTSFSLATVHTHLIGRLGTDVPLVTLYEHPTIASLAERLSHPAGERTARPPAPPARTGEAPRGRAGLNRLNRMRRGR